MPRPTSAGSLRLLKLPVLTDPTVDGMLAGFDLTGYFLERSIYVPSRMRLPPARDRFLALLRR